MNKQYKGYNGNLVLTDNGVTIERGIKGFLLGGGMLRGNKTIPYQGIVAVQLKKSGITSGYIQLTLKGGNEAKGGLFQSVKDENTINFMLSNKNYDFEEAKNIIEEKINGSEGNIVQSSSLDELEKLANLKDRGVITDDEFDFKKKELLNIK